MRLRTTGIPRASTSADTAPSVTSVGVGVACGAKYTGGIMVLPLVAAAVVCAPEAGEYSRRQILLIGLPIAAVTSGLG